MIFLILVFLLGGLRETETLSVEGVLGKDITIECAGSNAFSNIKYFCKEPCQDEDVLISSRKKEKGSNDKYSIVDQGNTFKVTISHLTQKDSGTYRCGIERIGVDTYNVVYLTVMETESPVFPRDLTIDKLHLPLYLTVVMCMAAILCVCLFTLCLLLAVKQRRPAPRHSREISSDYETMMPGVRTEPELGCSCSAPDCAEFKALPLPPPDLYSHFTSKHRESTVTLGLDEYADVEEPGRICRYQHLDPRRLEEHVYHSLHGNSEPKDGPLGVEEQINC